MSLPEKKIINNQIIYFYFQSMCFKILNDKHRKYTTEIKFGSNMYPKK